MLVGAAPDLKGVVFADEVTENTEADKPADEVETIWLNKKNTILNFNPEGLKEIEGCVHDKVYYAAGDSGIYAQGYYFLIKSSSSKLAYKLSLPFKGGALRFEYALTSTKNDVKITTNYYSLLKMNENNEPYVAEHDIIPEPTVTATPVPEATATPTPAPIQAQEITIKTASKKYTGDSLRKAKKTFNIGASAMTSLSYEVASGSKYISVNRNGVVTVKQNTPKGTYTINVTAKATDEYYEASATVTITVTAATPDMKKVNIRWDLKKNKTVKYKTTYIGFPKDVWKNGTLTIKDYKVKNAKKSGYKQLTFRVDFNRPASFSQKELKKIGKGLFEAEWPDDIGGNEYVTLVDYETGVCLEHKNTYKVTTKFSKWNYSGTKKTFQVGYGGSIWTMPKGSIKVTVTYPNTYKNLCIVAGGYSQHYSGYASDYFKGKSWEKSFSQAATSLYSKKYKTVAHAMRVK